MRVLFFRFVQMPYLTSLFEVIQYLLALYLEWKTRGLTMWSCALTTFWVRGKLCKLDFSLNYSV